jgi:hypothetical protein
MGTRGIMAIVMKTSSSFSLNIISESLFLKKMIAAKIVPQLHTSSKM